MSHTLQTLHPGHPSRLNESHGSQHQTLTCFTPTDSFPPCSSFGQRLPLHSRGVCTTVNPQDHENQLSPKKKSDPREEGDLPAPRGQSHDPANSATTETLPSSRCALKVTLGHRPWCPPLLAFGPRHHGGVRVEEASLKEAANIYR